MIKINDVFDKMISMDNLKLAAIKAGKDKNNNYGVRLFFDNPNNEDLLIKLHDSLKDKTFVVSPYTSFNIHDPKERTIYKLPFYPDRIVQHAIVNILEPFWYSILNKCTYSCVVDRGINGKYGMYNALKSALLSDKENTKYCLKDDIHHYYLSIKHKQLKEILREEIADKDVLWLLDLYVDSIDIDGVKDTGIPIGSILSQFEANLYLSKFDWFVKKKLNERYYYRYNDDMIFLSSNKERLHEIFSIQNNYVHNILGLDIKKNYQIFKVDERGIDIGGYVFFHDHILLRKRIKKNLCRKIAKQNKKNLSIDDYKKGIASWFGYIKFSNSKHLMEKVIPRKYKEIYFKYV
jgi:RNA-directed DNA polymerase